MAIRTYDILLDSYNSTMPEPIVGRQGDRNGAVTLHVTITDRGTAVDLTGQTIELMAETAKGTAVVVDNAGVTLTDAVNGKFDYAIPNALWSEAGKIKKAYFSLNDTDGQQTTYDLIFMVKAAVDVTQDKADDYIAVIDGTIRDLQSKADDYIAVIDGTVRDLQSKVDAIYATYQAGNFYNKSESDSRFTTTLQVDNKLANYHTKSDSDNRFVKQVDTNNWQKQAMFAPNDYKIASTKAGDDFRGFIMSKFTTPGVYYIREVNMAKSNDGNQIGMIDCTVISEGNCWYAYGVGSSAGDFVSRRFTATNDSGWQRAVVTDGNKNIQVNDVVTANESVVNTQKRFTGGYGELNTCPAGTDFGVFLMSTAVPFGLSMIRDENIKRNALTYKESSKFGWSISPGTDTDKILKGYLNRSHWSGWLDA